MSQYNKNRPYIQEIIYFSLFFNEHDFPWLLDRSMFLVPCVCTLYKGLYILNHQKIPNNNYDCFFMDTVLLSWMHIGLYVSAWRFVICNAALA